MGQEESKQAMAARVTFSIMLCSPANSDIGWQVKYCKKWQWGEILKKQEIERRGKHTLENLLPLSLQNSEVSVFQTHQLHTHCIS